ncbi:hypothetical protein CHK17_18835 [Salmonella enterica subsp. enterica serovar Oskarshamn]|nr:hypothetical protein [Salmonella enterica subsp. enterica serovar Oskarshamn]
MEITLPSMSDKKWTCDDLLSSYRFWGITFFFLVLSFISSLGSSYGVYFWSKSQSIPADRIGVILVGVNGPSDVVRLIIAQQYCV